jgi:AhpD family alkylhydroperoxidase
MDIPELLIIGVILLVGYFAHALCKKTKIPRVTVLLILGIISGPSVLNIIPHQISTWFPSITHMTLAMVSFLLGVWNKWNLKKKETYMSETYPEMKKKISKFAGLLSKELPNVFSSYMGLHKSATKSEILDTKTKELMALALAVGLGCDGCIAFHTYDSLKAGASRAEILETLGVAILMGGGASMTYATHAMEALEQFDEVNKENTNE